MTPRLKELLQRVQGWPEAAQEELAQVAHEIEQELGSGSYQASPEELSAIDEADHDEIASDAELAACSR